MDLPNWIAILVLIFLLENNVNIPLITSKDFLELSVKQLTDYLSVRGSNTSGRKVVDACIQAFCLSLLLLLSLTNTFTG